MNKLEIIPESNISELLNTYSQLEDKLISIAPIFKKLKNPILRKTIAKVTSIRQAAIIGGISIGTLINELRKEVGQNETNNIEEKNEHHQQKPEWLENKIQIEYDATEDLDNGIHPVVKVLKEIELLNNDELYLLKTPFQPLPLIEKIKEKGFLVYSISNNVNQFLTYIKANEK